MSPSSSSTTPNQQAHRGSSSSQSSGGSNANSSISFSAPQLGAHLTGDRELLWDRIRQTDSLQSLLSAIDEAGFKPVVLPRSSLLREGVAFADVDFGAVLGQLGVFGALLDYKTVDQDVQRELTRLELELVQLGLSKHSINLLRRQLQLARNVSKAVCLVIDDCAPPSTTAKSVFELLKASGLGGSHLPAIIFGGGGDSGTVTRIEDRDADGFSDASSSSSSGGEERQSTTSSELFEMRHKLCSFTDMMLVAYESNGSRSAV